MSIFKWYEIVFGVGNIIGIPIWMTYIALSQKRRASFFHRLGITNVLGPKNFSDKQPVWIHALSVGEVHSAIPFVTKFANRFPHQPIVFSASTQTGFETAIHHFQKLNHDHLSVVDQVVYFPYDVVFAVRRIIPRMSPLLTIIVETDIWPGFLYEMNTRNIPVFLVNARLSDRSFRGYRRFQFFTSQVFSLFTKICTQTETDAIRFHRLGIPYDKLYVSGNFKFDQDQAMSDHEMNQLREALKIHEHDKIIVAGSTHPGEEEMLAQAFSYLKENVKNFCLIIAPRDPSRSKSLVRIFSSSDVNISLYSDIQWSSDVRPKVIIINTIGILKKLYALADIAFIGGSLVDYRGHNPLEPAAYAKPVIFGPFMSDFSYIAETLIRENAAVQVNSPKEIYRIVIELLQHPTHADRMGQNAFKIFNANKGAIDKTLNIIHPYIVT